MCSIEPLRRGQYTRRRSQVCCTSGVDSVGLCIERERLIICCRHAGEGVSEEICYGVGRVLWHEDHIGGTGVLLGRCLMTDEEVGGSLRDKV